AGTTTSWTATASLPSSNETGKRGQGREAAGTKPGARRRNPPKTSDRVYAPVHGVVFPQCSLGLGSTKSSDERTLAQTNRWRSDQLPTAGVWHELPDFLRAAAGVGGLGSPLQRLLARWHVDDAESADGFRVRAVRDR